MIALVDDAAGLMLGADEGVRVHRLERDPHPEHGLQPLPPGPGELLAIGPGKAGPGSVTGLPSWLGILFSGCSTATGHAMPP